MLQTYKLNNSLLSEQVNVYCLIYLQQTGSRYSFKDSIISSHLKESSKLKWLLGTWHSCQFSANLASLWPCYLRRDVFVWNVCMFLMCLFSLLDTFSLSYLLINKNLLERGIAYQVYMNWSILSFFPRGSNTEKEVKIGKMRVTQKQFWPQSRICSERWNSEIGQKWVER